MSEHSGSRKSLNSPLGEPEEDFSTFPPNEAEFKRAKAFLQKGDGGVNIYDHMSRMLTKLLNERPGNIMDMFEDISKLIKKERFKPQVDTVHDIPDTPTEVNLAMNERVLFDRGDEEEAGMIDDEESSPLPNVMEISNLFEECGVGLGKEETFRILLSLKTLVESHPLATVRFWGKIFGISRNYIIAECEYREGEEEEDEDESAEEEKEDENPEEGEEEGDDDTPPKSTWKPPVVIPKEEKGTGANKKTYFVINEPGNNWVKLPTVTPAQLVCARKISKYFTGILETPIVSYPPFPGTEMNYLRAQIARISAGTQISPLGFYQFDEEEEIDEEAEGRDHYIENPDYEGVTSSELIDPSLGNWNHHTLHILPQGRCSWFNPSQKGEDEFEDEDEEEEKEEPDEPEPEIGPPLLTPLSEDAEIDGMMPWTVKLTSKRVSQYALACIQSNLWPGAYAFGIDKRFDNLYIGWGQKFASENYSPPPPPPCMSDYPSGPEITEIDDPTVEEEAALKAAQDEALEGEEEVGEEEGEEEDD